MILRNLMILTIAASSAVFAAPGACPVTAQTVTFYMSLTEGCLIDNLLYSNFTYDTNPTDNPPPDLGLNPTSDDFMLMAFASTAPAFPGTPDQWTGLKFFYNDPDETYTLNTLDSTVHFHIGFDVTHVTAGGLIQGVNLMASLSTTSNGNNAKVREIIEDGSSNNLGQMQVTQGGNGPLQRYFDGVSSIHVDKEFLLTTSNNSGSTSSLGPVYQNFLATPEPGSLQLMSAGGLILLLGLMRRSTSGARSKLRKTPNS